MSIRNVKDVSAVFCSAKTNKWKMGRKRDRSGVNLLCQTSSTKKIRTYKKALNFEFANKIHFCIYLLSWKKKTIWIYLVQGLSKIHPATELSVISEFKQSPLQSSFSIIGLFLPNSSRILPALMEKSKIKKMAPNGNWTQDFLIITLVLYWLCYRQKI